jgi:SulP family sulfate permease
MNFNLSGVFRPKLFSLIQKRKYDRQMFMSDLIAGIIVAIIALPLAIAFGIASGVSPQQGLITAIVAGFLVSFFGGSNFLIGGPTGAFIIIIVGIIGEYGTGGLMIATILAGIFLVAMGLCKMGSIFKFIPFPIVVGFTSGIALTIFTTQVKDFFGFTGDVPSGFVAQWRYYFTNLDQVVANWPELVVSVSCLLIIIFWNKVSKKIPGSLIAIIFGTVAALLMNKFAGLEVATIGSKFPELSEGMSLPSPKFPEIDTNVGLIDTFKGLVSPAFTIALLCAIESLMAAMVADGATGKKHNSNTELIGQGIANIVTPLFGGIPATGALARTMASINNGGKSPVTGLIHAVVLLLIYLFLMPYVVYIPLACLAAILVIVAYNMSEWRSFKYLLKGELSDVSVLLLTFFLTVVVDLTVAIEVGVVLAIVLFVKRVMESSSIDMLDGNTVAATEDDEFAAMDDTDQLSIPDFVEVYEINGPFFFGLASRFEEIESNSIKKNKVRIIRMRKVPFIDSTGVNNLRSLCKRTSKRGVQVILSGVNDKVLATLHKFGVDKEIGEEFIFPHIIPAIEKANEIVNKSK